MHRKPEADMMPLDTKIEKTLRNLKKVTSAESTNMENQRERLQPIPKEAKADDDGGLLEAYYSR